MELSADRELDELARSTAAVVLVLSGVLLLEHKVRDKRSAEVMTGGDLFSGPMPARVLALTPARVCLVRSLRQLTEHYPQVAASFAATLLRQQGQQAQLRTVAHLPRADDRVLAMLGLLAERLGQVHPDGIHVPIALTHQQLGRLIGAQRPTVTTAVGDLTARGALARTPEGGFILSRSGSAEVG